VIVIARHPAEVARSMQAQRWSASIARSHLCWLQHMLEAEHSTRGVARSLITYDALLADWRTEFERVRGDLALEWPLPTADRDRRIDAFLDRHERRFEETVAGSADVPRLAVELFDACRTQDDTDIWSRIAAIGETFRGGADAFGPCLDEAIVEASLAHFEIGESRKAAPHSTGQATLAELGAAMTDLLDGRLSPLREAGTRTADRLEAIAAGVQALHGRLAGVESAIADDAGSVLDRVRALADALAQLQQDMSRMASQSADASLNRADELRAMHESITALSGEVERLRASLDGRFSFRKWLGGASDA
jgi:hypothetical protein